MYCGIGSKSKVIALVEPEVLFNGGLGNPTRYHKYARVGVKLV